MDGPGIVRKCPRVYDDAGHSVAAGVDGIHHHAFMIRLQVFEQKTRGGSRRVSPSGVFLEVTPEKIVQTRRYDFPHPTLAGCVTTVTTHFLPTDRGTRIVVRHEGFGSSEPAFEHAGGWERMLDWLGEHLWAEARRQ